MKYEYLKGSEKYFEGAPSWAAYYAVRGDGASAWASRKDDKYKYITDPHGQSGMEFNSSFVTYRWFHGVEIIAERQPITDPELKTIYGDGVHDDTEALQQRIDIGIDISNIIGEQGNLFNISKPLQFNPITEPVVSQQFTTEWEGLPPVGIECKHLPAKHCVVPHKVTILAHTKLDSRNIDVAVFQYGDVISFSDAKQFIPIRSPEDVARDEAVAAMFYKVPQDKVAGKDLREAIYDAIAAGKIPGITLSGK